jgi:hypothetical protein
MKLLSESDVYFDMMSNYVKVSEYAKQKGVTTRTVYRWSQKGDIEVEDINGVLHVKLDDESDNDNDIISTLRSENGHLKSEIGFLRARLEQAEEDRQRSDTIIMQLTRQLEQQTLMLEDMRQQSLWRRIRAVFATEAV